MSGTTTRIGSAPYPQYLPPVSDIAGGQLVLPAPGGSQGNLRRVGMPTGVAGLPIPAAMLQVPSGDTQQQPTAAPIAPPPIDPQLYLPQPVAGGRMPVRPSEDAASDARGALAAIVNRMTEPGANQMIGYRVAADLAANDAASAYDANMARHQETTSVDAAQEAFRRMTEAAEQRANAIRTSAINNPAGASAQVPGTLGYELIRPEVRQQADAARAADVAKDEAMADYYRNGGRTGGSSTAADTRQTQRLTVQQQQSVNTAHDRLDAAERAEAAKWTAAETRERGTTAFIMLSPQQQQARMAEIRAQRDAALAGITQQRQALPPRAYPMVTGQGAPAGAAVSQPTDGTAAAPATGTGTAAATAAPGAEVRPPIVTQTLPPVAERIVGQTYQLPAGVFRWTGGGWQKVQ